jgi:NAD(P)-dependent dehydrogenase (short-subunit alcohol dehydrogenase family)
MEQILITGSNRGIGLGLVKEYMHRGETHTFATCRNPRQAKELNHLAETHPEQVTVIQLDITDKKSIRKSVEAVKKKADKLDVLINNAGVNIKGVDGANSIRTLTADKVTEVISTNAVWPLLVTQAYLDLLIAAGDNSRIVMMSSQMGSMELALASVVNAYGMSKAAMNYTVPSLAAELKADNITVVAMHPGHVSTDMGGESADLSSIESAQAMINVIEDLTPEQSGQFLNWKGESMPW